MKFNSILCKTALVISLVITGVSAYAGTLNLTIETYAQIEFESLDAQATSMASSLAIMQGEQLESLSSGYVSDIYKSYGVTTLDFLRYRQKNLKAINAWYETHPDEKQARDYLERECASLQQAIETEENR